MNDKLTSDVRDDQNQQVTVRRLPDGTPREALFHGLNGPLLSLNVSSAQAEADLNIGDLVEIATRRHLYLGEVNARETDTIIVGVEHSLDRAALEQIQRLWQGPAGS